MLAEGFGIVSLIVAFVDGVPFFLPVFFVIRLLMDARQKQILLKNCLYLS